MKCNHCKRIIDKEDNFYELEGNVYCSNCVSESTTTYYTIGNDPEDTYTDEEISEYSDIYEYIADLKFKIKWAKERRKELELITNPNIFEKKGLERYKNKLKILESLLEKIQEEYEVKNEN